MPESWTALQVPARADSLQQLRTLTRDIASAAGVPPGRVEDIVLAVNEACMNVIQHGYRGGDGSIELSIAAGADALEFRIRDDASRVTLDDWRPRALDELRPGGLGVHFIREIMDEVAYLPMPGRKGNLLTMKKYLNSGKERV